MGKIRISNSEKVSFAVTKCPREFQLKDGKLFCCLCSKDVNCEKKTRIEQHRDGELHRSRMSNLKKTVLY